MIDLHVWDIGPRARACIVSLRASVPRSPAVYRDLIASRERLTHVTIEVHALADHAAMEARPVPDSGRQ